MNMSSKGKVVYIRATLTRESNTDQNIFTYNALIVFSRVY